MSVQKSYSPSVKTKANLVHGFQSICLYGLLHTMLKKKKKPTCHCHVLASPESCPWNMWVMTIAFSVSMILPNVMPKLMA